MSYILGLDVGGSAIKYALMDKEANFIEKGTIPTPLDKRTFHRSDCFHIQ